MLASATSEVIVSTLMEEFGYNEEEQKKIKIKKLERAKGAEDNQLTSCFLKTDESSGYSDGYTWRG